MVCIIAQNAAVADLGVTVTDGVTTVTRSGVTYTITASNASCTALPPQATVADTFRRF